MGLSQLSKSSSCFGSPVTFSARRRNLYEPLGIVVPLAKTGDFIAIVLYPKLSGSFNALSAKCGARKRAFYLIISTEEVQFGQWSDDLHACKTPARMSMRECKEMSRVQRTRIEGWLKIDIGFNQVYSEERRPECQAGIPSVNDCGKKAN